MHENYVLNWEEKRKISSYNNENPDINFISSTIKFPSNDNKNTIFINRTSDNKLQVVTFNEENEYINNSTYIPLKGELNIKPLSLPGLYKTHYILNEKKNKKVKERKFSQIEYVDNTNNSIHSNIYVNNDLYVGFHNLYNIHSNHLHSKEIIDSKNVITSIITRYRAKFSTFIYYKGKQEEKINRKHSKSVKVNDGLEKIGKIIKTKNIIYK